MLRHHINRFGPDNDENDEGHEESEKGATLRRTERGEDMGRGLSWCSYLQQKCLWLVMPTASRLRIRIEVRLEAFDYVMGLAILANAILMGIQADLAVRTARTGEMEPPSVRFVGGSWLGSHVETEIGLTLGFIFTLELVSA